MSKSWKRVRRIKRPVRSYNTDLKSIRNPHPPKRMTMRKIEFPPGTRPTTKVRVGTLAWATNRRGRHPWKSANVVTTINDYITKEGYVFNGADVSAAIKWLCDNKYAVRRKEADAKRTLEFAFLDDVDLNGFLPEGPKIDGGHHPLAQPTDRTRGIGQPTSTVAQRQQALNHVMNGQSSASATATATPPEPLDIEVPLPGAPERPPVFRLAELNEVLTEWSDRDQESYARWVERALESLYSVLHK